MALNAFKIKTMQLQGSPKEKKKMTVSDEDGGEKKDHNGVMPLNT